MKTRALIACAALLLAGCPKEESAPPMDDRLLEKLKAEQERLAQGGQPGGPPRAAQADDALARAVTNDAAPRELSLPAQASITHAGVTVSAVSARAMQKVFAGKVALSTGDTFLELVLEVQAEAAGTPVDFTAAKLALGPDSWEVAGDVQRSTKAGPLKIAAGSAPTRVTVYFEPETRALSKGLTLVLPFGQDTVELPLQ